MSIRLRFTIALTLLGLLLVGGYAVFAYGWEVDDLDSATEREVLTLGRALATSLGNALRDRQRADIDEMLRALEPLEPKIFVHVTTSTAARSRAPRAIRSIRRSRRWPGAPR